MGHSTGRVIEVRLGSGGHTEACISCPEGAVPSAGQYTLASDPSDSNSILRTPIFLVEKSMQGFWAAPLFPTTWGPGTDLDLVGPLGHGFDLPRSIQRLGLAAVGDTVSRLMPLVHQAVNTHIGMTLFTDLSLPKLPAVVEVYPLGSLKSSLDWPDFMALDVPLDGLAGLRDILGLPYGTGLSCPAQLLITSPFPCSGIAQCGACAVPARRGWKLACEDGPVFDLRDLKW
jgi:dihydroorotate dehydrogenase electron transfer subunit